MANDGLFKKNSKISALKQKDGSFVISIPRGTYLLNKVIIKSNGELFTLNKIPQLQKVETEKRIVAYQNVKTGDEITIDEYLDKQKELLKFQKERTTVDGRVLKYWPTEAIDQEFDYKKFNALFRPMYKEFTFIIADYEITVEDMQYSNNPYIKPIRHVGGKITENLFIYNSWNAQMKMVHEIGNDYGYTFYGEKTPAGKPKEKGYTISSHSGLRFMQISGNYVMSSAWEQNSKTVKGTYEECLKAYEKDEKRLRKLFLLDLNKNKSLDKYSALTILGKIKSIEVVVNKIDYKIKSRSEWRIAIKFIKECKTLLETIITEK